MSAMIAACLRRRRPSGRFGRGGSDFRRSWASGARGGRRPFQVAGHGPGGDGRHWNCGHVSSQVAVDAQSFDAGQDAGRAAGTETGVKNAAPLARVWRSYSPLRLCQETLRTVAPPRRLAVVSAVGRQSHARRWIGSKTCWCMRRAPGAQGVFPSRLAPSWRRSRTTRPSPRSSAATMSSTGRPNGPHRPGRATHHRLKARFDGGDLNLHPGDKEPRRRGGLPSGERRR
jgi:hypothetical protein